MHEVSPGAAPIGGGARRLRRAFWVVLGLATLVRLLFAVEVVGQRAGRERLPPLDMWMYRAEAELVLAGDWTLSGVPDLLAGSASTGVSGILGTPEGRRQLRAAGERPLVDAPAYPWLVAASLRATGSTYPLLVLQVGASLLVTWLTFRLARGVGLSQRAALLAMTWVAFHPVGLFEAGFLQKTTLITLVLLLVALALARWLARPGPGSALLLGAALGAVQLTQGILPLLLPFVALGGALVGGPLRARTRDLALGSLTFLLVCAPLVARSQVCGTSLLHNGQVPGWLVVIANFRGADGLHLVQPPVEYTLALTAGGQGALGALLAAIGTHPTRGDWLWLMLRKLQGFWSGYEAWNNTDFARDRHLFRSLWLLPLSSWVLLAFGLLGLPAAARRWRRLLPVWTGLLVVLAVCLLSFAFSRYRAPAVPYLAILAALGVERLGRPWAGPGPRAGVRGLVACLASLVVCWPGTLALGRRPGDPELRGSVPEHLACRDLAGIYARDDKPGLVRDLLVRAALGWPADDLQAGARVHLQAYAACRALADEAGARRVLASARRLDPSGALAAALERG